MVRATNRVEALPESLREPGRLDREIAVGPHDVEGRLELLRSLLGSSFDGSGGGEERLQ